MTKKAQIFTLSAILLLLLFFMSYEIYSLYENGQISRKRVKSMDSFLYSLENDFERAAYISGFRILFLAQDYIIKNEKYINVDNFFSEAFFNGSVEGVQNNLMVGSRYQDVVEKFNQKAAKINVNLTLSEMKIQVFQENPWEISFSMNFTLNMTDVSNLAYWYKQEHIVGRINIEGFEDPLYVVNTHGKVPYKINRTVYDGNYVSGNDVTNLNNHLNNRLYSENSEAPSFLMRLEGQIGGNENGIESFVDLGEFSRQGVETFIGRSVVDHEYFSGSSGLRIIGMPSWFRLDSDHVVKYNCTGLTG